MKYDNLKKRKKKGGRGGTIASEVANASITDCRWLLEFVNVKCFRSIALFRASRSL
jgi:hypothetical protein